ncbi:c-type cytochrome [Virgibacillus necropolis]|uniref:Cytochrome C551 n=1 Tax=Virgibacillus necropolis TaxID=163877 RepID=A0A221M8H1_9BACI|nr:cytochrome c [Virgibacillus necropolis]ASN03930.1 cytochrome C551 [Virgibacillus necropolis]
MLKNKKFLVSLLFLALIMVISACGGGGGEEGSESGGDNGGNGGGETTAQGDAANGAEVYQSNCMSCHGQEGAGGSGPALQASSDYDSVIQQVKNGGGGMPAFEGQLSEQEIADVSAYIAEKVAK